MKEANVSLKVKNTELNNDLKKSYVLEDKYGVGMYRIMMKNLLFV